jgi:hypothetical protein
MATLSFFGGTNTPIDNLSGSGLGFFGGSFGSSVELNAFQGSTYITNGAGTIEGAAVNNIKYASATTGYAPGIVPATGLKYIPNKNASLNIRFTHASVVKTQNVRMRIFDRANSNNPASGVWTRVAELLKPMTSYSTVEGSGDVTWWGDSTHDGTDVQGTFSGSPNRDVRLPSNQYTVGGSGIFVPLAQSPGPSGFFAGDGSSNTGTYTQHDWYVALSASPKSIGAKTQYGLYVSLEYL